MGGVVTPPSYSLSRGGCRTPTPLDNSPPPPRAPRRAQPSSSSANEAGRDSSSLASLAPSSAPPPPPAKRVITVVDGVGKCAVHQRSLPPPQIRGTAGGMSGVNDGGNRCSACTSAGRPPVQRVHISCSGLHHREEQRLQARHLAPVGAASSHLWAAPTLVRRAERLGERAQVGGADTAAR